MSDIRSVLLLLCQHLKLSINIPLKPEYFRLAKFNEADKATIQILWHALDVLSFHVVKQKGVSLKLQHYDSRAATKLRLAYLQYPTIEFYAETLESSSNRQLLLAFAWLLGTQNVLDTVVQEYLSNGHLGTECSLSRMNEVNEKLFDSTPDSLLSQINMLLHVNGKINNNIKQINEFLLEKSKLVAKVHAASTNASSLPHLSVSELAMIKSLSENRKGPRSRDAVKHMRELTNANNVLDVHMKWMKKEAIFYEWMVTVIEEHNKAENSTDGLDINELLSFTSLLYHEIKKTLSPRDPSNLDDRADDLKCASRFLRTHNGTTEAETLLQDTNDRLNKETESLDKRKEEMLKELKDLLRLIPSCVQI